VSPGPSKAVPIRQVTPSGFEPYRGLEQFAADQEKRDVNLIQLDVFDPISPTPSTASQYPRVPRLQKSLLDLDIDEAIPDNQSQDIGKASCEDCGTEELDVCVCNVCNFCLCSKCWDKQLPHKKGKLGLGGIPHEKTPPDVAKKVGRALAPPSDEKARMQLYEDDELTAWFGEIHSSNEYFSANYIRHQSFRRE
jgi:hypothetical protein